MLKRSLQEKYESFYAEGLLNLRFYFKSLVFSTLKREAEQVIDEISQDELLEAGASEESKEKAKALEAKLKEKKREFEEEK